MKLSGATAAALVAAAAAGGAVGFALGRYSALRPGPEPERVRNPAPRIGAREPAGGYEARWEARRDEALWACRGDPEVESFAQAVTCALNSVYPEAAPWTAPGSWVPWMERAAEMVELDIGAAASRDGRSPRGWEVLFWLRGDRELVACRANSAAPIRFAKSLALCAAMAMYPAVDWSTDRPFPWQNELLAALTVMAQEGAA